MKTIIEIYNYRDKRWERYTIADGWWEEFAAFSDLESQGYSREKDIRSRVYEGDYIAQSKR